MKTKKILLATALIFTGSMIATTSQAQVYVNAHVGFGIPAPRVYIAPPVVYQDEYAVAPYSYEDEYPGCAYYEYPAWNGHYRDRFYFAHYRPYFEREHREYFNRGRFDRERFEHERFNHGRGDNRGNEGRRNGGYDGRNDHGRDHDNHHDRGHRW